MCIDTPPSLGLLTINALTAADKVIVPVQCEYLSMRGLIQLQNTLSMIREELNPDVEIEGILPTLVDTRTVHAKEAIEILEENFGDRVFATRIRKTIRFAEAPVKGTSVLKYDPDGVAAESYRELAKEVLAWQAVSEQACAKGRWRPSSSGPTSDDPEEPATRAAAARGSRGAAASPSRSELDDQQDRYDGASPSSSRSEPQGAPQRRLRAGHPARRAGAPGRAASASTAPATSRRSRAPPVHQPVLRVVGVGGAGVNAVNRMIEAGVEGVEFIAVNTDLQSLQQSAADVTLHIGAEITRGLGSGSDPTVGHAAAIADDDRIKSLLKGSDMVFVAAGSGRRHRHGRRARGRAHRARDRRAHRRHRDEAVRLRGHAPRARRPRTASTSSPSTSTR